MKQDEFKPYVPAEKITPEITFTSVVLGVLLAVVFGAANAYLGLRVGMTVSASIPAAVISMGLIRGLLRRDSILENNMVQTIGSAGESLAAGAIFTMPVLYMWADEGKIKSAPDVVTIALIALCGGVLGVLFMVPLRNALIVREHGKLPYPEGTACAEVLLAGEEGGSSAKTVFSGLGLAAVFKFVVDGLKVIPGVITAPVKAMKTAVAAEVYPALIGVGYICGPKISSYMFAGGLLGWLVFIPLIVTFGANIILYPGTETIAEMYSAGGPDAIWSKYIRYIGAGAVAAGGIISLIKSLPLIVRTFIDAIKGIKGGNKKSISRTDKDLDIRIIGVGILACIVAIWLLPQIPVSLLGAVIIVLFGFFFATVSSRMVGIVGSSNNPVSGMAIATLLIATLCLKATGDNGSHGMMGAIAIGSIICIVAAMAGDTSQDLKTGFLLGSTPKKQQIGELLGAVVSAFTIGLVLMLLGNAWEFGSKELPASQASIMKLIVEGVMDGNLPWVLIFIGVFTAIVIEVLGISVLPVAIGLYLPLELSSTIMIGGAIKWFVDKKSKDASKKKDASNGILFCSGMIAGEGLVGILLAILTVVGIDSKIDLSGKLNTGLVGGIALMVVMVGCVLFSALKGSKVKNEKK